MPSPTPSRSTRCSPLAHHLPTPSHTHRAPLCSPVHSLARPCTPLHTPSRALTHPPTAARQVQRGLHYLLHEDAQINEIRTTVDSRAKSLGMKAGRPKLLFKKCLFTKQDERLISEKAFIHLFFIQAAARPHAPAHTPRTPSHTPHTPLGAPKAPLTLHLSQPPHTHPSLAQAVNDVVKGSYLCKASDAVKLAAIHYYVWHGPFDAAKEQFSVSYMRELRLSEQLMPTPLVTAQVGRGPEMNGPRAAPMPPPCRPHAAPMQPPCPPP